MFMEQKKLVPPDGGWGWIVVIGVSVVNLCTRSIEPSFGLLFGDLLQEMGVETTGAAIIMSTLDALINFSGLFVGPLIRAFSYRKVSLIGSALCGLGLILTYPAKTMAHLLCTYSIINGLGVGLTASSTFVALNNYFVKRRGQAVGFSLAGTAFGMMLMPQAVKFLLDMYSFRGAILVLGAFALNGLVGSSLLQPAKWYYVPESKDEEEGGYHQEMETIKETEDEDADSAEGQTLINNKLMSELAIKTLEEHGQTSWTKLTKVLQRCRGQIRQRYCTISTYLQKHPKSTLATVPRRKHNLKEEEDAFNFLRMVADQFLDSPNIPSIQKIENILIRQHREEGNLEIMDNMPNFAKDKDVSCDIPTSIDDMLTNFFCNSFKINPSKCIASKFVTRAARNVQEVLDVLQASLDIPPNFDEDMRLDNLDVAILNTLVDDTTDQNRIRKDKCELLPPTLNSLVGLRSLLIKYYGDKMEWQKIENNPKSKKKKKVTVDVRSDIIKQLLNLSDQDRRQVEHDRKLFYRRFQALFKWPALMTVQDPSSELEATSISRFTPAKIQVKRTYSKLDRNAVEECPEKRIKSSDLPGSSSAAPPLKLTPVTDRSIIADLIRDRNKKLFSMETVKCGKETKMVIKEVNFRPTASKQLNKPVSSLNDTDNRNNNKIDILNHKVTTPETDSVVDNKKQDMPIFIPEQGKCIVLNREEDNCTNMADDLNDKDADDVKDLNRLEAFLNEQSKGESNEDGDLEDLKKLQMFLKNHEENRLDFLDSIENT